MDFLEYFLNILNIFIINWNNFSSWNFLKKFMKIHGQNKKNWSIFRTCTSRKASCVFHVNFYHPNVGKKVVEVFFSGSQCLMKNLSHFCLHLNSQIYFWFFEIIIIVCFFKKENTGSNKSLFVYTCAHLSFKYSL
jgi:hypothetical protein